ncbi:MAG: glycogen synthase [Spirochaetales bacterium]|nr:glycogen synthase [Spirochaetales bacterium]
MKKILFVASECVPFVKTGGLADVVGSLPKSFDKAEYDIRVILPNYHAIKEEYRDKMENVYYFQMDNRIYVGIKTLVLDGIKYYFVDNEQYFGGLVPYYDMFKDLERFAYFSKAVLSALPLIDFRPDIIHCHDWQSALVPVYLNTIFQGDEFYRGMRTVFTIHNIRFQGNWDVGHIRWVTALPNYCFKPGLLVSPYQDVSQEFNSWNCSFMRGALVYSDYITTVSNSYAQEIQTKEFGDGLEDILAWRKERLWGIINGIDYTSWSPSTDKALVKNYDVNTVGLDKKANKVALLEELGLKENTERFTLGIISRLTDQKGLDIVDLIMDELCNKDINLVVLGTGDEHFENMFRYYQGKYPNKVSAQIRYSDPLAHKIYAGVDALLVPSAFEPCGLTQLIALHYGTVPIVHEIGGLKDTVKAYNQFEETGTGFSFSTYGGWELMDRINHAMWVFYDRKDSWLKLQQRGMKEDWSWTNSSQIYKDLYSRM